MGREPRVLNRKTDHVGRDAVLVDRTTDWGNPFRIDENSNRQTVIDDYRAWLFSRPDLIARVRRELAGRDLVCWCKPEPCHADVLLDIARAKER